MRTDRTSVCIGCRLRFAAAAECPGCGGTTRVVDLSDPTGPDQALTELSAVPFHPGRRTWIGLDGARAHTAAQWRGFGAILAVLALVAVSPFVAVEVFGTRPLYPIALAIVLALGWVVVRQLLGRKTHARTPLGLAIAEPEPTVPHPRSRRLRGIVRSIATVDSPLRNDPCVAYRLVGEAFGGAVDDAYGVAFEVVTGDGSVVRVEPAPSTIDLPVMERAAPVEPGARLRDELTRRGLYPDRGELRLAEAILRDGDVVEVEGVVDEELSQRGYRHAEAARVVRERAGSPLVIRVTNRPV